jgi:hypothetical protein
LVKSNTKEEDIMKIDITEVNKNKRWDKGINHEFNSGDLIISIQKNGYIAYDLFITDTDDKRKFLHDLQEGSTIEYIRFEDFFGEYAEIIDVIPASNLTLSKIKENNNTQG